MRTHLSCLGFVTCDCYAEAGGQAVRGECKISPPLRFLSELLLAPVRLHHYRRIRAMAVNAGLTATANNRKHASGEEG